MLNYLKTSWRLVLALATLGGLIFMLAFYVGSKSSAVQENKIDNPASLTDNQASVAPDSLLEGYFLGSHEEVSLADGSVCHTLVVREGTETLISYYKELIEIGNTVQSLTPNGDLRINLPWNDMPEYAKQRLLTGKEVGLSLIKKSEQGKDADQCHSFLVFAGIH